MDMKFTTNLDVQYIVKQLKKEGIRIKPLFYERTYRDPKWKFVFSVNPYYLPHYGRDESDFVIVENLDEDCYIVEAPNEDAIVEIIITQVMPNVE